MNISELTDFFKFKMIAPLDYCK